MPRNPPQLYNVVRAQDGALVIVGVPLKTARSEKARLNAEAGIVVGRVREHVGTDETGQPMTRDAGPRYQGMFQGARVEYEIRSQEGVVIS